MRSRDNSTWPNMNASSSSHINWPSPSKLSHQQQFGRYEQSLEPDSYLRSPHAYDQDQPSFDGASETSSLKTKETGLWSRISVATSITSLSSRRSAKAPELDLEIPNHSLSLGTLFGSRSKGTRSASKGGQGILAQTSQTSSPSVYTSTPQRSRAGPSILTSSPSYDWDQEMSQLTAGTSPQTSRTNSTRNDSLLNLSPIEQALQSRLRIFHVLRGTVTSGTLEGLVQFLITGFSKSSYAFLPLYF